MDAKHRHVEGHGNDDQAEEPGEEMFEPETLSSC